MGLVEYWPLPVALFCVPHTSSRHCQKLAAEQPHTNSKFLLIAVQIKPSFGKNLRHNMTAKMLTFSCPRFYELFAARITGEEKGLASQEGGDIGNGGGGMGWGGGRY